MLSYLLTSCESSKEYDATKYDAYPSFDEVVEFYYLSHLEALNEPEHLYKFEKKNNGWILLKYDSKDKNKVVKQQVIWTASNASFQPEDAIQRYEENKKNLNPAWLEAIERRKNVFGKALYDKCPVFGYVKETEDVIELLEGVKDLPLEELECLARAYSKEASRLFFPNEVGTGFIAYDSTFHRLEINKPTVHEYIMLTDKSAAIYGEILRQDPNYQTAVGSIAMKYGNDRMMHYYESEVVQRDGLSAQFIKEELYNETILTLARNYLKSCPSNAILFTWGDNDTFPLLYLQAKENYRKDVTIVNTSLSNLGRYIYYLTNVRKAPSKIETSLAIDKYKLSTNDYLIVQPHSKAINWKDYMNDWTINSDRYLNEQYTNTDKIVWHVPTNKINAGTKDAPINIEVTQPYLLKSDIFLLDVIATNYGKRPICFSMGYSQQKLALLGDYLETNGWVYELKADNTKWFGINAERSYELVWNEYDFPQWNDMNIKHGEHEAVKAYTLHLIHKLLDAYMANNEVEKGRACIQKAEEIFPPSLFSYDYMNLMFGNYYWQIGEHEAARKYWDKYIYELVQEKQYIQEEMIMVPTTQQYQIGLVETQIQGVEEIVHSYGDTTWVASF